MKVTMFIAKYVPKYLGIEGFPLSVSDFSK